MNKILSMVMVVGSLLCTTADAKKTETKAEIVNRLNNLTPAQNKLLTETYNHGKNYGYAGTLGGILMTESDFGKNVVNKSDGGSYGAYQIHLPSYMKSNNLKGKKTAKVLSAKLVKDSSYGRNIAIDMLQDWNRVYAKSKSKNKYKAVLASYNAGTKGLSSPNGRAYANKVAMRAKVIEEWMEARNKIVLASRKTVDKSKKV